MHRRRQDFEFFWAALWVSEWVRERESCSLTNNLAVFISTWSVQGLKLIFAGIKENSKSSLYHWNLHTSCIVLCNVLIVPVSCCASSNYSVVDGNIEILFFLYLRHICILQHYVHFMCKMNLQLSILNIQEEDLWAIPILSLCGRLTVALWLHTGTEREGQGQQQAFILSTSHSLN